eukprot:CAMPEP_0195528402 /NCGR_PEP_ID=MMETSP0794_2-20130614/30520_1 /TAXON_ID=515487 /ORGANISM="Stephanopyxis turris, Strain CCMP 815" /LENGTH=654 /DNA_ID=CAMNT_0040659529 /DNA_START=14 /DNA_END=1978 /DNA_ORIENTATION=-
MAELSVESKCQFYVNEDIPNRTCDLILEGSWRGLAIAEELMRSRFCCPVSEQQTPGSLSYTNHKNWSLPPSEDFGIEDEVPLNLNGKDKARRILQLNSINLSKGWNGSNGSNYSKGRSVGGKNCVCGTADDDSLREVGLGWWISPSCAGSPSGFLCDMLDIQESLLQGDDAHCRAINKVTTSITGKSPLDGISSVSTSEQKEDKAVSPLSLQRWPAERVALKEKSQASFGKRNVGIGFSAAALQEMQLLYQVHNRVPGPQGHPNFLLPLAIALQSNPNERDASPGRTSELAERSAHNDTDKNTSCNASFLVFEPTPLVFQTVLYNGCKKRHAANRAIGKMPVLSPTLFRSWFHDLLSALAHCHANHIVLRMLKPDQIHLDHSGVAKFSELATATVIPYGERSGKDLHPFQYVRKKGSDKENICDPYQAPEVLLGAIRYTKETDIWGLASMMAYLLLGKPLFTGKDVVSHLNCIFKIAGSPGEDNFLKAKETDQYKTIRSNFKRRYKPGVGKALKAIFGKTEERKKQFAGAMQLLEKMLHLDPKQRISAADALKDEYMVNYVEMSQTKSFRVDFAKDWISLKGKLTGSIEEKVYDESKKMSSLDNANSFLRSPVDDEDDELYKMDFDMELNKKSRKRPREEGDVMNRGDIDWGKP